MAKEFLSWFDIPPGQIWSDVGCGTGALTKRILENYQPKEMISIDASGAFISHARRSISAPNVHFSVGLAQSLPMASNSIDVIVSGLVLNFVPSPEAAISEMIRLAKPGGRIGVFVWDYGEGMQFLRYFWDAAIEIDPQARDFDEGLLFPVCREGQLESLLQDAGLKQLEARPIEINTIFQNFDDYWQPFLGKVGAAPHYLTGVNQNDVQKIADYLQSILPTHENGSISLRARSWAVKGSVEQ